MSKGHQSQRKLVLQAGLLCPAKQELILKAFLHLSKENKLQLKYNQPSVCCYLRDQFESVRVTAALNLVAKPQWNPDFAVNKIKQHVLAVHKPQCGPGMHTVFPRMLCQMEKKTFAAFAVTHYFRFFSIRQFIYHFQFNRDCHFPFSPWIIVLFSFADCRAKC